MPEWSHLPGWDQLLHLSLPPELQRRVLWTRSGNRINKQLCQNHSSMEVSSQIYSFQVSLNLLQSLGLWAIIQLWALALQQMSSSRRTNISAVTQQIIKTQAHKRTPRINIFQTRKQFSAATVFFSAALSKMFGFRMRPHSFSFVSCSHDKKPFN